MVLASVRATMPSIVPDGRSPTTATIIPTTRSSDRSLTRNRRCWGSGRTAPALTSCIGGVLSSSPLRRMDGPSVETFEERAHPAGEELLLHERMQPTAASITSTSSTKDATAGFLRLKMAWTDDGDTRAEDMEDGEPRREASTSVVVVFPALPFVIESPSQLATSGVLTGGSILAPPLPSAIVPKKTTMRGVAPFAPPLDDEASSKYRALIERYMTVRRSATPKTTTTAVETSTATAAHSAITATSSRDEGVPAAVWTCRRCGAERRESRRRSAAEQWLRSHLRACVGATLDEDSNESAIAHSDTAPKPPTMPPTIVLPVPSPQGATPPAGRLGSEAPPDGTPHHSLPVQPDWAVDVCLGHGPSPGYRLFQDAVKLVRIPIDLRGGWEGEAVRQARQNLTRRTHPHARILVRDDSSPVGGGGGESRWRVANDREIRRKILALYRYYFSFQPPTPARSRRPGTNGVAEPWPFLHQLALRQLEEEAEMEGHVDDDYFGEKQQRTEAASNLDAGIIRHVLLLHDDGEGSDHWDPKHCSPSNAGASVVSPNSIENACVSTAPAPANLPLPNAVLLPNESRRRKSPRSHTSPPCPRDESLWGSTHRAAKRRRGATPDQATAAADDGKPLPEAGPHDGDAATTASDSSAAQWAARARLRRREAGRLEHWVCKVRNARQAVARRTVALERERQRYQALAVGAASSLSRNIARGSAVPDPNPQEPESSQPPPPNDRAIAGCSADQLVGRLQEAHRACRAQVLQLEQRTTWWQQEWVALKALLKSSEKPTPEFLAEEARCKLLMTEAHALLL